MTDAALLEAVRLAVRAEVEPLRRALERLAPPPLSPAQSALLDALADTVGGPFTAREVIELSRSALSTRQPLRDALAALEAGTAHKLGLALGEIAKRSAVLGVRLVRLKTEGNRRVWMVEGV